MKKLVFSIYIFGLIITHQLIAMDCPLHAAVAAEREDIVAALLKSLEPVDGYNEKDETALHVAAENGNCKIINLLLEHGANINAQNFAGETPLHKAVYMDNPNAVVLLLLKGAAVNKSNINLDTPLHYAALFNRTSHIVDFLLNNRASINIQNENRMTPLHCAVAEGNSNIIKTLVVRWADLTIQNCDNNTPATLAEQNGFLHITNFLNTWPIVIRESLNMRQTFVLASHTRLGYRSPARHVSVDNFREICSYVMPICLIEDQALMGAYRLKYLSESTKLNNIQHRKPHPKRFCSIS